MRISGNQRNADNKSIMLHGLSIRFSAIELGSEKNGVVTVAGQRLVQQDVTASGTSLRDHEHRDSMRATNQLLRSDMLATRGRRPEAFEQAYSLTP